MTTKALAFLMLFAGIARADLPITPDQKIDMPSTAPASKDQQTPSIAFGGGMYLAVWRDGIEAVGQVWALRAARINPDGTFIDQTPFTIRDAGEDLVRPAVAWDGSNFLVVWERAGTAGDPNATDIFGASVSPTTGAVSTAFTVAGGPDVQSQPAIAGGDGYALVTYNEFATLDPNLPVYEMNETVWGVLLHDGQIVKPKFQITPNATPAFATSVAYSTAAKRFLVAYRDVDVGGNVWETQLDTMGAVTEAPFQLNDMTDTTEDVSVAVLGSQFVVGWSDYGYGANSIYARAVPANGTPTADAFLVAMGDGQGDVRPQLVGVGGLFVAIWESIDMNYLVELFAGRFTASGTRSDGDGIELVESDPIEPRALPGIATSYRSAIASSGSTGFAVYQREGSSVSGDDVLMALLDPSTSGWKPETPLYVAREPNTERTWSVASNGKVFLLVWEDNRSNNPSGGLDVYGLRIALDGTPIDAAPFIISTDDTNPLEGAPGDQWAPSVAGIAGGGPFLVVWSDSRGDDLGNGLDLYAARVGATGGPQQLTQHVSTAVGAQLQPAIAASDAGWLVAWEDFSPSVGPGQHFSAVFSTFVPITDDGEPFFARQLTLATLDTQTACAAAVTWNGTSFFVAYERPCTQDFAQPASDLIGRWHAADGTPIPGDVTIANKSFNETVPSLASLDGRVFVVWREQGAQDAILGATFADRATISDAAPVTIFQAAGVREAPAIVAAGGAVLVDWIDDQPAEVAAVRLHASPTFDPIDTTPVVFYTGSVYQGLGTLTQSPEVGGSSLSSTPRFTPTAAMVASATGETLVAYDALETIDDSSITRAHFRKLGLAYNGAACSSADACGSGICTAGTCCDVVCDGACQACSTDGCVATPTTDARCPVDSSTSCATLSTSCRTYADAAPTTASCVAFGECASAVTAAACTMFTDKPDGTSCTAPGCTASASCSAGACACSTENNGLEPARNLRCDAIPGQRTGGGAVFVWLLVVAALVTRRRLA